MTVVARPQMNLQCNIRRLLAGTMPYASSTRSSSTKQTMHWPHSSLESSSLSSRSASCRIHYLGSLRCMPALLLFCYYHVAVVFRGVVLWRRLLTEVPCVSTHATKSHSHVLLSVSRVSLPWILKTLNYASMQNCNLKRNKAQSTCAASASKGVNQRMKDTMPTQ